ncbi:hypothetical protein B4U80_03313 [Leptotrombidium deliense]|uniref:Uncharacterized protein n=1 Tax=Leptotrombidium deliense TaxID=299467 RepID=A0A443RV21_9ACAR|nr:hypothetical protein B4U80_03313 [Leptotrombidium deliense]
MKSNFGLQSYRHNDKAETPLQRHEERTLRSTSELDYDLRTHEHFMIKKTVNLFIEFVPAGTVQD